MKEKGRFLYPLLLLMLSALYRIPVYLQPVIFRFRTDDFGTLAYPAYLAGYDWSNYISGTNHYYGYGYYWIFAPFFKLFSSPYRLMYAVAGVNSLLIICSSLLVYHLLITYFGMKNGLFAVILALVPTLFQGDINCNGEFFFRTDNEIPFFLVCWLVVWLLLAANRSCMEGGKKRRLLHAFLMALTLIWGQTVHERSLALFLAVVFAEIFLGLFKKKWLFHPGSFFISLAVLFPAQRFLRAQAVRALFQGNWPGKNTSAFSGVSLWFLKSVTAMKTLLMVLFGNLHALLIRGFGLPAIAIVLVSVWLAGTIRKSLLNRRASGKETLSVKREAELPEMLIMLVFGCCIAITVAGIAVRWGGMLVEGIAANEVVYGYKGITYGRYYQSLLGPIVLAVLLYCLRCAPVGRGKTEAFFAVFFIVELVFFAFIFPYLVRADMGGETNYVARSMGTYGKYIRNVMIRYAESIFWMLAVFIAAAAGGALGSRMIGKRKSSPGRNISEKHTSRVRFTGRCFIVLAGVILLIVLGLDRQRQIKPEGPSLTFLEGEEAVEVISQLEKSEALPECLYLPNSNWCFPVQVTRKELTFICGLPEGDALLKETLVVTKTKKGVLKNAGYEMVKIGPYRYWTNCEKTAAQLRAIKTLPQDGDGMGNNRNSPETEDKAA